MGKELDTQRVMHILNNYGKTRITSVPDADIWEIEGMSNNPNSATPTIEDSEFFKEPNTPSLSKMEEHDCCLGN